jgi:hypothetical protein
MMDGRDSVEFRNVEVLARNQHVLVCLVAGKLVSIPPGRLLPGSTIRQQGDIGTLVLTREVAEAFKLL